LQKNHWPWEYRAWYSTATVISTTDASNFWQNLPGKGDLNSKHMTTSIRRVKTSDLELKDRLVSIQRVTKVTKGGRTFSFSAIVVVGNEDGIVGHGLGKANEVTTAIAKGIEDAKKNLIKVPIHKGTIPHEQLAKYGGASVFIKPASSGTGVVAGGAMRAVLESVGVKDVLAKSKGSSNPHNLVKATFRALMDLRDAGLVAEHRGISMDKVFNG
jgi:small subunit ribosomal protein S5